MLAAACGRVGFDDRDAREPDGAAAIWPNEPPGFTVLTDQPWSALASLGWLHNPCASTIVSDPAAPLSPPDVLEHPFPVGFPGDASGCIDFFELPAVDEVYLGVCDFQRFDHTRVSTP